MTRMPTELLPVVVAWARKQAAQALIAGMPLTAGETALARRVGVQSPQRVRLLRMDRVPSPPAPPLRRLARQWGVLGDDAVGLTLGYAVFVVRGRYSVRVLSHELRHVHQYEQYGSLDAFLTAWLAQVARAGYRDAPLESDARTHEVGADGGPCLP